MLPSIFGRISAKVHGGINQRTQAAAGYAHVKCCIFYFYLTTIYGLLGYCLSHILLMLLALSLLTSAVYYIYAP